MLHILLRFPCGWFGLLGCLIYDIDPFGSTIPETTDVVVPPVLQMLILLVYLLIPYLLGSINTAILTSKKLYGDDVRDHGSGNAGFTNTMRTYGKKAAVITFVGDILKTVLAVTVGWLCGGYLAAFLAGFACFIGHIFPVFHKFKGGKGVLCFVAILFMLDWRIFLIELVVFVALVALTKYISFGSVMGAVLFPILLNRMNNTGIALIELIAVAMAVIVVVKHWQNIKRIWNGTESKFKFKKSKTEGEDNGN